MKVTTYAKTTSEPKRLRLREAVFVSPRQAEMAGSLLRRSHGAQKAACHE